MSTVRVHDSSAAEVDMWNMHEQVVVSMTGSSCIGRQLHHITPHSVKLNLRDKQTDKRHVRLSVTVSLRGVHPMVRGTERDKTNKYTKFGPMIIRKIINFLPPDVAF